ncbi:MAG: DUF2202 domain-containing protein [Phycisphaerae bacterium]|nr:DUF2202 domain-containing protein [Phycisphaerae bacterium]
MRTRVLILTLALVGTLTICAGAAQRGKGGKGPAVPPPTAELTAEETANILHMREEEKMARDVYLKFAEMYDCAIFTRIAAAEQRHMDAVGLLVIKYGLTDPVTDDTIGAFSTLDFETTYNTFVEAGTASLLDALEVGVQIEELDIADLEAALLQTDKTDIQWVFENLLNASNNHWTAFTRKILAGTSSSLQGDNTGQTAGQATSVACRGRGGRGNGGRTRGGNGQCDRLQKRDGGCLYTSAA